MKAKKEEGEGRPERGPPKRRAEGRVMYIKT